MSAGNSVAAPERTLVATRLFDAPREVVYRAWTDPKQLAQWFPPKDFTAPRCEVDARPGGIFRVDMKGPDGAVFVGEGVFREVVPNERLVFTFAGEEAVPPPILVTVLFETQGEKTKLTMLQTAETVADYLDLLKLGATEGIDQSFEKLEALLARTATSRTAASVAGRTLTLTRVFDAPRELVWTAYTDPKHIVKWMFANEWESPFADTDVRPGGAFRIGMRPADHHAEGFTFSGTYREVVKPERIVQALGDGRVMTTTFEDVKGKTKLTLSVEMAESDEAERTGWTQILENLASHVATMTGDRR
jgi:uncharacterized protein YndB with AHSA1/START domain